MVWIILTFVFGWLLCGAWATRMEEKAQNRVGDRSCWLFYLFGLISLIGVWLELWPTRLWRFAKGIIDAWKQAQKT